MPTRPATAAGALRLPRDVPVSASPLTRWVAALQPGWVLLPLRLFLGITFVYAGIQKLTDPQFFTPSAIGYIGHQIQGFAHGSPIGWLLLHVALPHATFFGGLIAYGEIAIGLGTLVGLLARPAAFFGFLLSLIFFLSASWRIYPYFYGADIVFVFAWISLALRPHAGLPNLDMRAAAWVRQRWRAAASGHPLALALLFSVPAATPRRASPPVAPAASPALDLRARQRRGGRVLATREQSRRTFLTGLGTGVAATFGLVWLWNAVHPAAPVPGPVTSGGSSGATTGAGGTAQSTGTAGSSVIAKVADVPTNSAATFSIPSNGDPGVVVHLDNGKFVAYDATCTHAGCPVQYDPGSKDLYCPCHGAVFDPANAGAALQGPTNTPLAPVAITVQSNGDITLA
jgi:thiosulfate dehydrogenase [quinone] large subunit